MCINLYQGISVSDSNIPVRIFDEPGRKTSTAHAYYTLSKTAGPYQDGGESPSRLAKTDERKKVLINHFWEWWCEMHGYSVWDILSPVWLKFLSFYVADFPSMSAFVDLCFGDFTERETLAFLSAELSPDQAHIAKVKLWVYLHHVLICRGFLSGRTVMGLQNEWI